MSINKLSTMFLIALTAVNASPKLIQKNYTAVFETSNQDGISTSELPGLYEALYWSVFTEGPFDFQSGFCADVCPQSFPAEAFFEDGPASISAIYKDSRVLHFTMHDLYFGCNSAINTTYGQENTPGNCTMTVKGYRATHERLPGPEIEAAAVVDFAYIPNLSPNLHTYAPSAPMGHFIFPTNFDCMTTVTFEISQDDSQYMGSPQVLLDNVSYLVTNKSGRSW